MNQQIREATAWGRTPGFLVHDNDRTIGQFGKPAEKEEDGRRRRCRSDLDLWLDEVMGIRGLPSPYGARPSQAIHGMPGRYSEL